MTYLPYARRGFRYNNYKYYLEDHFGERVQRVSVEGGFTCPNRDGTLGTAGCIYCNNHSFSPPYADSDKTVAKQLSEGIRFLNQR
ncbi:MAG: TIGR01212 family radical SAM protein, partial [Fidelibacterota bacterium]